MIRSTDETLDGTIATYSGGKFRPLEPDPAGILIEDIEHALANSCRFTGHVSRFYSVAQHSVHCAEMVEAWGYPWLAFTALMHDASEAYLSDISRPIKMQPDFGDVYRKYETRLEAAIAERFGLWYPYPDEIKRADNALLRTEQRDLMPDLFRHAGDDYYPHAIQPWSPVMAKQRFHEEFVRLSRLPQVPS